MDQDPMSLPKDQYQEIIERIAAGNSPVGIDAQYTHAIIIKYLQEIEHRLYQVEDALRDVQAASKK